MVRGAIWQKSGTKGTAEAGRGHAGPRVLLQHAYAAEGGQHGLWRHLSGRVGPAFRRISLLKCFKSCLRQSRRTSLPIVVNMRFYCSYMLPAAAVLQLT